MVHVLPHVNASLNGLATLLLIAGYIYIKLGKEKTHRNLMLACFGVSVAFLGCYVTYHIMLGGSRKFPQYPPTAIRYSYYFILLTHVVLAAITPFLAITTIVLGLMNRRTTHRKFARWTFPIWLYVSITGVVVYLMLYQLYPPVG